MFHNWAFIWKGSCNSLVCICTKLQHISLHYREFSSNCCIHFILLVSERYLVHQIWGILHICFSKRELKSAVVSWRNSWSAGMLVSTPVKEGVGWTIIAGFDEAVIVGYAMYSQLEFIWEGCCSLILISQAIARYPIIISALTMKYRATYAHTATHQYSVPIGQHLPETETFGYRFEESLLQHTAVQCFFNHIPMNIIWIRLGL